MCLGQVEMVVTPILSALCISALDLLVKKGKTQKNPRTLHSLSTYPICLSSLEKLLVHFVEAAAKTTVLNKELFSLSLHRVLLVKGKVCKVFCGVEGIPKIVKAQASNSFLHILSLSTGTKILKKILDRRQCYTKYIIRVLNILIGKHQMPWNKKKLHMNTTVNTLRKLNYNCLL